MALIPIKQYEDLKKLQPGDTVLKTDLEIIKYLDDVLISALWKQEDINTMRYVGENEVNTGGSPTALVVAPLSIIENETTLLAPTVVGVNQINVVSTVGFAAGKYITIFNVAQEKFFQCKQVGAAAGNIINIDTPMANIFNGGSVVTVGTIDLAVNGAGGNIVFGVRNTPISIPLSFDLTRCIFVIRTGGTPGYNDFGDVAKLAKGLVIRKKLTDNTFETILNAKSNAELQGYMYDVQPFDTGGFFGGVEGLSGRFTFTRLGSPVRLNPGEDLQVVIQDNISGLTEFFITVEGNQVI